MSRGFRAFTTFVYGQHWLTRDSSPEDASRWMRQTWNEDVSQYRATVLYGDDLLTIVQLSHR